MAFEFKKLSDVNVIEAMKDGLNVLVEDGGEIVKLAANSMIPEDVALKSDIPNIPEFKTSNAGYSLFVNKTGDGLMWNSGALVILCMDMGDQIWTTTSAKEVDRMLDNTMIVFRRMVMNEDAPPSIYYSEGFDMTETGAYRFRFPKGIQNIIVDPAADTIALEDIVLKNEVDYVPVPMAAEVGQVVAVKAVDENGKPTEWEAVDMGGGYDMVLVTSNGNVELNNGISTLSIESGTCENLAAACGACRMPHIALKYVMDGGDYAEYKWYEAAEVKVMDAAAVANVIEATIRFMIRGATGEPACFEVRLENNRIIESSVDGIAGSN